VAGVSDELKSGYRARNSPGRHASISNGTLQNSKKALQGGQAEDQLQLEQLGQPMTKHGYNDPYPYLRELKSGEPARDLKFVNLSVQKNDI
jgi:hypothetical protein